MLHKLVKNETGSHLVSVNGGDAMMLNQLQYGIDTTTIRHEIRRKLKRKKNQDLKEEENQSSKTMVSFGKWIGDIILLRKLHF